MENFDEIKVYLATGVIPSNLEKNFGNISNFKAKAGGYYLKDDILYKDLRRVIVEEIDQLKIMEEVHQGGSQNFTRKSIDSHIGVNRMYREISRRYFWKRMFENIRHYIRHCEICQKVNSSLPLSTSKPYSVPLVRRVGAQICLFILQMPLSYEGNQYLIIALDYTSKYMETTPLKSRSALDVAKFLLRLMYRYGCQDVQINDEGSKFCNDVDNCFFDLCHIKQIVTCASHPQVNKPTGRTIKTLKSRLLKLLEEETQGWDEKLDGIVMAYNMTMQGPRKESPYKLMYGRHPKISYDILENTEVVIQDVILDDVDDEDFERKKRLLHYLIHPNSLMQQKNNTLQKEIIEPFKVGDEVLIKNIRRDFHPNILRQQNNNTLQKEVIHPLRVGDGVLLRNSRRDFHPNILRQQNNNTLQKEVIHPLRVGDEVILRNLKRKIHPNILRKQKNNTLQKQVIHPFRVGDEVLLRNLKRDDRKGDKFTDAWLGPYTINKVLPMEFYQLENLKGEVLKEKTGIKNLKKFFRCDQSAYNSVVIDNFQSIKNEEKDVKINDMLFDSVALNIKETSHLFMPTTMAWKRHHAAVLLLSVSSSTRRVKPSDIGDIIVTDKIKDDGNCFFRCISKEITNSQCHYHKLRAAVITYMLGHEIYKCLKNLIGEEPKDYILKTSMRKEGVCATKVEVAVMATFLQTNIYTFINNCWIFQPPLIKLPMRSFDCSIYITNDLHCYSRVIKCSAL